MTRLPMTTVRAGVAMTMALVLGATLAGLIGTGLIYTALTAHVWGALIWGLPLALGGLYWCGRALAQGQRSLRGGASSGREADDVFEQMPVPLDGSDRGE